MARLVERTEVIVRDGEGEAFAAAFADRGRDLLMSVPGVVSVAFGGGVENPLKYLLLVEWRDMAAHDAFGGTPQASGIRQLVGAHAAGATMEHFTLD